MRIRPYFARNTYSWQITARALLNIQLGYTIFGVALMPKHNPFKKRWWSRVFPVIDVCINKHTGQCDQVILFRVRLFGYGIQYMTKGETYPEHHRWKYYGLKLV